jgi:hypothetical protein
VVAVAEQRHRAGVLGDPGMSRSATSDHFDQLMVNR